ncbi:MAG: tetratricopeptide repeat protein [Ktedonobacteraceae bacterium]
MAPGADSNINKHIGEYRLLSLIGHGAFGSVYQAEHLVFDDDIVAIKLLRSVITSNEERQRFFQEARVHKKLSTHPRILPIRSAGIQDGIPYMIMEYAPGGSLQDLLCKQPSGQPLTEQQALAVLTHIGEALHHAHQQNIVHRDLKPDNILFNARGEALLADFGIAAILSSGTKDLGSGGTPAYMAPEQFQGMVSTKSDQYALGCIAYELLTGRHPFDIHEVGLEALWYQHTKVTPDTPKKYNPRLSDTLAQAILTALAKDRTARYPDIPTFLASLTTQKTAQQWFEEGYELFEQGKYEEAIHAYDQAIRLNPNDEKAYNNKGYALENLKRYEEAIQSYDQAIRLNPNYADAYDNKGIALYNLKRYEEAIQAYDQAIRLNPNHANAYNNKGAALFNLKRYEEAIQAYDQAIRLNPNLANAYYNKGNALRQLGRTAEAERVLAKAKELGA